MTPQIQIDQVKQTIDEVRKEVYIIKQTWIQKQQTNVQLINQRNQQFDELNKVHKCKYLLTFIINK